MSYSCFISFKKMEANEIIPFFRKYRKEATKNLQAIADENFSYMPYVRGGDTVKKQFSEISKSDKDTAKAWARGYVFQYKYFYDESHKLLGVFGIPCCMRYLFEQTVCFQNSCDQDYEKSTWEGIEYFEKTYQKWFIQSPEDIVKRHNETRNYDFYKEYDVDNQKEIDEAIDYYRRTFAYEEIWDNYENYLFNDEEAIYFTVFGGRDIKEPTQFIKMCHEAFVKDTEEFEKEFGFKESRLID